MPASITYNQGDVVLVRFPFTNQEGDKQRPALVISANWYNNDRQDVILAAITTVIPASPTRDQVLLTVPDQRMIHADYPCIILTGKIFTIKKAKIIKTLGHVSPVTSQTAIQHLIDVFSGT